CAKSGGLSSRRSKVRFSPGAFTQSLTEGDHMPDATVSPAVPTTTDPAVQTAATDVAQAVPQVVTDAKKGDVPAVLTDAENAYEQVAPLVPTLVKEAKAGYKTTEFWLVIVYEAVTQTGAVHLPGTWGKAAAGIAGVVAYVLSRGLAKNGTPNEVPVS